MTTRKPSTSTTPTAAPRRGSKAASTAASDTAARSESPAASAVVADGPGLFIVESVVKQRTISTILGDAWVVVATYGHIADIPERNDGVDVEAGFVPRYELTEKGAEVVAELRAAMARCSRVVVATDPDREGEIIAAHVVEHLAPTIPVERVDLGAITATGIAEALASPRAIDDNLVAAATTRRILDRLFGYRVSDVTRKKIRSNTTAGRVQSPAMALVVERELERLAHVAATYWDVRLASATDPSFEARIVRVDGVQVAAGADFDASGRLTKDRAHLGPVQAATIAAGVEGDWPLVVSDVAEKPATRNPSPPHTGSTLTTDAVNRLGMSAREAGDTAQSLFARGLITYPRTDTYVHRPASRAAIKAVIRSMFGAEMVNLKDQWTSHKGKNVQGAHEGIRPTDLDVRTPTGLTKREQAMYDLIWRRTIASQMVPAAGFTRTVTLRAEGTGAETGTVVEFTAAGTTWTRPGFMEVWGGRGDDEPRFPALAVGDVVPVESAEPKEHVTQPPARFTDASLIEALEEAGVGRPSTYIPTIAKLRDRYVFSKRGDKAMIPTVTAFAVHRLLSQSFAPFVDLAYTERLEERLDRVASGDVDGVGVLEEFFFGDDEPGLAALVETCIADVAPRDMWALTLGELPGSGETIVVRPGRMRAKRFSPYIEAGDERVSIDDATDFCALDMATLHAVLGSERERHLGDKDGLPVSVKRRLASAFFQWGGPGALPPGSTKPVFAPLMPTMNPATVTLEDALTMLALPRVIGVDPATGEEVTAAIGRTGAYVASAGVSAPLDSHEEVFTVTVDVAAEKLAAKRARAAKTGSRRRGGRATRLKK